MCFFKAREYSLAAFNPSGDTVVVGSFNRFYVYNYSSKRNQWEEVDFYSLYNQNFLLISF